MTVGFILSLVAVAALVAVWVVVTYRQPPIARRNTAAYRHQHTENPDYVVGNGGRGGF